MRPRLARLLAAISMDLTGKQKRHLRALAHHLDPVVAVGKEGNGPGVVKQLDQALERHELVKVKVQRECPETPVELGPALSLATRSAVAQIVGRVLVLYRRRKQEPSIVLPRADGEAAEPSPPRPAAGKQLARNRRTKERTAASAGRSTGSPARSTAAQRTARPAIRSRTPKAPR